MPVSDYVTLQIAELFGTKLKHFPRLGDGKKKGFTDTGR